MSEEIDYSFPESSVNAFVALKVPCSRRNLMRRRALLPQISRMALSHSMRAVKTLKNVEGVWVSNQKCVIKGGKIAEYRVNLKVTFILE